MADFYMTALISISAAISVASLAYCLLSIAFDIQVEVKDSAKRLPILFKLLLPLAPNVSPLASASILAGYRKSAREGILMAGIEQLIDEEGLVCVSILSSMLGIIFSVVILIFGQFFASVAILLVFVFYPKLWLNSSIRRRHLEIQKALPNVLDLLTLSVEAGRDFLTALRDILARRRRDALCEELERAFREIQLGRQRRVALKDLAMRVQQPDLTIVLNSIIQADELGVSIGQILRIQGDQLRLKRFSRAERLANEAPVKILFPLAVFIMPAVIIILLGPVILKGFNVLLK